MGELIGTATTEKDGLLNKKYSAKTIRNTGLVINFKFGNIDIYSTSSMIELYVYSTGNVGYYMILAGPTINGIIKIKCIGQDCCVFKFSDNKLYVLPNKSDITIEYKYALGRNIVPAFSSIAFSDFANITGNIITPTVD